MGDGRMKLPRTIRIGFRDVPVGLGTFADQAEYGCYHVHDDRIEISAGLKANMQRLVLVHECLHAMFATAMPAVDDQTEEMIVRALTPQILAWIRDNPRLLNLLAARVDKPGLSSG